MKSIIIVQNLLCNGCANLIGSELSKIKNIKNIEVDLYASEIMFDYAHEAELIQAKNKLKYLGYPEFNEKVSILTKLKSVVNCSARKFNIQV